MTTIIHCFDEFYKAVSGSFELWMWKADDGTMMVNVTKLCIAAGKRIDHWRSTNSSKRLIDAAMTTLTRTRNQVIHSVRGGWLNQGTYVHPYLVPHIASWISAEFVMKVSLIIDEWRTHAHNEQRYLQFLSEIKEESQPQGREAQVRDQLAQDESGHTEVECVSIF